MLQIAPDSLDQQRQIYQRAQSGNYATLPLPSATQPQNQNYYKQFYKQQLDDLVQQKNEQRRMQKQQEEAQRNAYNERLSQAAEAERLKDLSYKNYYNMLLDNQSTISKNYVSPFDQKIQQKERLVRQGVEQGKKRSDSLVQQEQRRQQEAKKNYRQYLAQQINEKYNKNTADSNNKVRQNEQYKKLTFTPQELAKFERQRKITEMQKYREDLDKNSFGNSTRGRSNTNYQNDFNVHRVEDRHNPMVNPLPFNIQNPYILREMQRRSPIAIDDSRYY